MGLDRWGERIVSKCKMRGRPLQRLRSTVPRRVGQFSASRRGIDRASGPGPVPPRAGRRAGSARGPGRAEPRCGWGRLGVHRRPAGWDRDEALVLRPEAPALVRAGLRRAERQGHDILHMSGALRAEPCGCALDPSINLTVPPEHVLGPHLYEAEGGGGGGAQAGVQSGGTWAPSKQRKYVQEPHFLRPQVCEHTRDLTCCV